MAKEMVEAVGIEPTADASNDNDLRQSITENEACQDPTPPDSGGNLAPDLDGVVSAWPSLPEFVKAAVMALVKTAGVQA
jgi:hypothetical protein